MIEYTKPGWQVPGLAGMAVSERDTGKGDLMAKNGNCHRYLYTMLEQSIWPRPCLWLTDGKDV
jgi:hypothetical protein